MLWRSYDLILGLAVASFAVCSSCADCANRVIAEAVSPGKGVRAVVFERNCGATTGFSTQVSLIRGPSGSPRGKGNLFIADDNHGGVPVDLHGTLPVKAVWTSDRDLTIRYPSGARVFLSKEALLGVRIKYETSATEVSQPIRKPGT